MSGIAEQVAPFQGHSPPRVGSAPGHAAAHERGILYRGPWEAYADGFSEHTRRSARALASAGCPVHLRSVTPMYRYSTPEDQAIDEAYGDLVRASIASYVGTVNQVVPTEGTLQKLLFYRSYSVEQQAQINAKTVLYTVWERMSGVAAEDVESFNKVGQAWVGCDASARLLKEAGVAEEKVRVVPCPYMPNDPHLALASRPRRAGPPIFYHIGKWEPRKEQRNIIGAFLMAFQPGEAMLLMKTSERAPFFDGYPVGPEAAIFDWLKDERVKKMGWNDKTIHRGVFLITEQLTEERLLRLHTDGAVYVSLSRGEGMDMPALDAKLSGNLLVYTPSGGPEDFATVEDVEVEAEAGCSRVPCHPFYRWPTGSTYLDYDIEAAVAALREAHAAALKRSPTPCDLRSFSSEEVGKRMLRHLMELGIDLKGGA